MKPFYVSETLCVMWLDQNCNNCNSVMAGDNTRAATEVAAFDRTRDYVNIRILLQGLLIAGNSIYHGKIIAAQHVSFTY